MASVAVQLLSNAPPQGVTTSLAVSTSANRVTFTFTLDATNSPWTISGLLSNNGDVVLAVDDRAIWMSHASALPPAKDPADGVWKAGSVLGVVAADAVTTGNKVKVWTVTVDRTFYKWAARKYTFSWFAVQDFPGRSLPVGTGSYSFTLPADGTAQYPMATLLPGKIMRGLFSLSTDEGRYGNISAATIKAAGINYTLTAVFPYNPADGAGGTPFSPAWQATVLARTYAQMYADNVTNSLLPNLQWCEANGLYCMGEADALYRNSQEQWWWSNHPQRNTILAAVRDVIAAHKPTMAGVFGMDETEFIPGFSSAVDTAALMTLWRGNANAPPWCWPGQYPTTYETTAKADFSTRYVKVGLQELVYNLAYSGRGLSLPQYGRMHQYMGTLCTNFPLEWVRGSQFVVKTPNYRKMSAGDRYNPGAGDVLIDGGTPPEWIPALCWMPLIFHQASVLRGYLYDNEISRVSRAGAPIPWPPLTNPTGLQVGIRPGYPEWAALAVGFKSIEVREATLTSRTPLTPAYEDNWVSGGFDGLRVAVNCSPAARACPYIGSGVLLAGAAQSAYRGGAVPPGGVVLSA